MRHPDCARADTVNGKQCYRKKFSDRTRLIPPSEYDVFVYPSSTCTNTRFFQVEAPGSSALILPLEAIEGAEGQI
jgi:hypothetical protein